MVPVADTFNIELSTQAARQADAMGPGARERLRELLDALADLAWMVPLYDHFPGSPMSMHADGVRISYVIDVFQRTITVSTVEFTDRAAADADRPSRAS